MALTVFESGVPGLYVACDSIPGYPDADALAQLQKLAFGLEGDLTLVTPSVGLPVNVLNTLAAEITGTVIVDTADPMDVNLASTAPVELTTDGLLDLRNTLELDRPVAYPLSVVYALDTPVNFRLVGHAPVGGALTYQLVSDVVNGSTSGTAPSLQFTPDTGVTYEQYVYTVTADAVVSRPAVVEFRVAS